ncbi:MULTISPECIES: GNAT family N-acetyltransferase [unclassified Deinococcus]|uniref:GNAT family N-acetyltransferase n=1 Tax=unclassified Deinococcus TaxID=2623546 RepID=UPI001C30A971|nr:MULTISPECIES: GNAT family N-acetyltransferase [unclassified Deinococcus]MDK2011081.1 GNAT family N-acetyltransferase [Deinococcus sp. 43]
MTIRPRRADDLPALVAALRAVHETMGYPSVWPDDPAAFVLGRGEAWVAQPSGAVWHGGILEVKRLFVSPHAQGLGLARALLAHARREASERRAFSVLQVNETSGPALGLYEREGWRFLTRAQAAWTDPDGSHPWVRVYVQPGP